VVVDEAFLKRALLQRDASEADAEVLAWQCRTAEPVGAEEGFNLRDVAGLTLQYPAGVEALCRTT
jgi:hypothetical protein